MTGTVSETEADSERASKTLQRDRHLGVSKGALAGFGALLCLVLTPLMASVWVYDAPGLPVWSAQTPVERLFGPLLESAGLLSFTWPARPYEVYGKVFFLVYLFAIPVVRAFRPEGISGRWVDRTTGGAWRVMYRSLTVAAVADFVAHWGVSAPGAAGYLLWVGGFIVEMFAVVVLLASTAIYGLAAAQSGIVRPTTGLLLVAAALVSVPTLWFVVGHLPNGLVLPFSIAWGIIGIRTIHRA